MSPHASRVLIGLVAASVLAGCGGGSSSTSTTVSTNYRISGTITGLTDGSVVLANGSATVTVAADATSWVFGSTFTAGSSYTVTVKTQPADEQCAVTGGGSGANTGDVGNVTVVCAYGDWNWEGGSDTANAGGVYGTLGTAAAGNVPGARYSSTTWHDSSGNLWLFGGVGYDAAGAAGSLNDLWRYSPTTGLWTWINGGDGVDASGVYGTEATAAATNVPGARYSASSWIDSTGNLWLFGGIGYDATGAAGDLNDLWRYSPATGLWTWVSGGNADNAAGVYGTQGTAAAGNVPGARYASNAWVDSSNNLWLFGGVGYDAAGAAGNLNDLWRYSPTTGQWTWISGGDADNAAGVYGTETTAAATNVPGARYAASSWIDSSGNLWLFGGYGEDSTGTAGRLNDLWQYDPSTKEWTWILGEETANATGIYGTLGIVADGNAPGARQGATSWIDASGNFWLFGGVGFGSTGVGSLNDLWQYNPTTVEWTWVGGSNGVNVSGIYGTKGTASVANGPGGRESAVSFIDSTGNAWVFGGYGYDSTGTLGYLNDLWKYTPITGS